MNRRIDISIGDAIQETGMTGNEVWISYFGVGGDLDSPDFAGQVASGRIAGADRMMLLQVLDDWYTERGRDHPVVG